MTPVQFFCVATVSALGLFCLFILVVRQAAKVIRHDSEAVRDFAERRKMDRERDDLERIYALPARERRRVS